MDGWEVRVWILGLGSLVGYETRKGSWIYGSKTGLFSSFSLVRRMRLTGIVAYIHAQD